MAEPLDGLLGPGGVRVELDKVKVGERWQRTLAVTGYPRELPLGWLAPLVKQSRDVEVSLHVEPFPAELAGQRLKKQRARFESTRRLEAERGALSDLGVQAAAEDAHELASRLARGESRLLRASLYLSLSARSEEELERATERVKALCASRLLHCVPASFRALDGWLSTLPLGLDRLRLRRTFDTEALAASFPFACVEPPLEQGGVFYGLSEQARRSSTTASRATTTTASFSRARALARAT